MVAFRRLTCAAALFALTFSLCVLAGSSDSQPAVAAESETVVVVDASQLPTDLREQLTACLPQAADAESFVLYTLAAADKEEKKGKGKGGKDDKAKGKKGDKGKDDKGKDDKGGKDGKGKAGSTVVEIDLSKLPPELTAQLLRYALSQQGATKDGKGKDGKGK
jgi:hypothetical protein